MSIFDKGDASAKVLSQGCAGFFQMGKNFSAETVGERLVAYICQRNRSERALM